MSQARLGATPRVPLVALAGLVCVALAVNASLVLTADGPRELVVLPIAGVALVALLFVAATHFEWFVLFALVSRASLDALKLGRGTGGANPASLLSFLFLCAGLVWLIANRKRFTTRSELIPAVVLFMAACIISTLTSQLFGTSLTELGRILSAGLMAVVLDRLMVDEAAVKRVLAACFASAIVPVAAVLATSAMGSPLYDNRAADEDGVKRLSATFVQANGFSRYLMFLIIMAIALFPYVSRHWKVAIGVGVTVLGVLLVLTYTRSSWTGLVLGVLVIGLYQSKKLLLALVFVMLLLAVAVPSAAGRITSLVDSDSPAAAANNDGNTLAWRLSYWSEIVSLANSNPVSGVGLKVTEQISGGEKQPHNDFLRAYVEMGLIGFTAYVGMVWSLLRIGRRSTQTAVRGWQRGVAVGYMACAVAFTAVSLVSNVMSQVVLLWYFFAFAAAASAVGRFGRAQSEVPALKLGAG